MSEILQGQSEVLNALDKLKTNFVAGGSGLAKKVSDAYVFEIQVQHIVESGRFLRAVDWHEGTTETDFQQYLIDSSRDAFVTYDGFIEGGTKFMPARFPAKKGIERVDFKTSFDAFVEDALGGGGGDLGSSL